MKERRMFMKKLFAENTTFTTCELVIAEYTTFPSGELVIAEYTFATLSLIRVSIQQMTTFATLNLIKITNRECYVFCNEFFSFNRHYSFFHSFS